MPRLRLKHMERAFLVAVEFERGPAARPQDWSAEDSLAELRELAASAGAAWVGELVQRRAHADAATLIGRGKVAELAAAASHAGADLVLFDTELSPTQQRNLETETGIRVLARTQLILDIFARHARTREGQLQVELAQLEYLLPRLTGQGRALSRLGGGIGTRGPGETKLETDRRRIHQRIRGLRLALERVRAQRGLQRRQRENVPLQTVALVGYTNAGKSTLFNRLTGADVLTSGRMFATLDPTIRSLRLPGGSPLFAGSLPLAAGGRASIGGSGRPLCSGHLQAASMRRTVLLSDTVGFLRHLPYGLITSFRATLEEVTRASLLLLVTDATSPYRDEHERQVEQVLDELEVGATPRLRVWNKADALAATAGVPDDVILVSARSGSGVEQLLARMDAALPQEEWQEVRLRIPHPAGRILHLLHEQGEVVAERHLARRVELVARVPGSLMPQLTAFRNR